MRRLFFLPLLLILGPSFKASAQSSQSSQSSQSAQSSYLDSLVGRYRNPIDIDLQFIIKRNAEKLILAVPGQGQTGMVALGNDRFRPNHVKPEAIIQFVRDSTGQIRWLQWHQDHKNSSVGEWIRQTDAASSGYAGRYKLKSDPYKIFHIREENGKLSYQLNQGPYFDLEPTGTNKYRSIVGDFRFDLEFVPASNRYKLVTHEQGILDFERVESHTSPSASALTGQTSLPASDDLFGYSIDSGFYEGRKFFRADSLRGMLTALRTCYDVTFYDLAFEVEPATKSIAGRTTIRFRATQPFSRMQVDLFANMKIENILFHNNPVSYTREYNAVFLDLPSTIPQGQQDSVTFIYTGRPLLPDINRLKGGFLWVKDDHNNPWIESVVQGSGASLWWPCKDHLSDKPDSMRISVTVPPGLTDISNGRLLDSFVLPDHRTRFDWYVDYPINNYNVVVYIGKYIHLADTYINGSDTMRLNYYCLPYDIDRARPLFEKVKPMLTVFENDFGPYPFKKDGFNLVEAPYPMEHQGAVSFGNVKNTMSGKTDFPDLLRGTWHEVSHEWWGNSITCQDMADFWIHESFATYAEVLAYEAFSGKSAARKNLSDQHPDNKFPIIGTYGVNDFRWGDLYPKGCLMLHTLRNCIADDAKWIALLRGIQDHFRFQSVTTGDIVSYINSATGQDYTPFFDQYLRHTAIPQLDLVFEKDGASLKVSYKWTADVKGFDMPVKVTTARNSFTFIRPTEEWQTLRLENMDARDFAVDTDDFYIKVQRASK
jgi:hypothetical protein